MHRGGLTWHDDDDHVRDAAPRHRNVAQVIQGHCTRAVAEANDEQILTHRMHIAPLERVAQSPLLRPIVNNAVILQHRMTCKKRLDEQLFGPPCFMAHRAYHRVAANHDAHVAREEQVGQWRKGVSPLVERSGNGPRNVFGTLDQHRDQVVRGPVGKELGNVARIGDMLRLRREQLPRVLTLGNMPQQVAHFIYLGEPLQHRHHRAMLGAGRV